MTTSTEFPVYKRLPVEIASCDGVRVKTTAGDEMIDFYGGHAVALLGHSDAGLRRVMADQAHQVFFQTNLVDLEVRRNAHDALASIAPAGMDRVFLVNSGAEANENALRLAFRITGRSRVVCIAGGFHGRTAAAGACTAGHEKWYAFPRKPFDVSVVPVDDVDALQAAMGSDVAAVIFEAVQGVAGARDLAPEFLQAMESACRAHGALLIADEVQCGMGRSGRMFAFERAAITPDIITTAKAVAGGFPAGAVIARNELADQLRPGDLGTTFGGGPVASALIVEVVRRLTEPGFLEHVERMGRLIRETCCVGPVTSVQGAGLLVGLRCDRPSKDLLPLLRARGILAGDGADPAIVRLMPPLVIGDADVAALRAALLDIGSLADASHRSAHDPRTGAVAQKGNAPS